MSVHKAISAHVNKQNKRIMEFMKLDSARELYIEEAIAQCRDGKPFSTEKINEVTTEINKLSKQGIIPARKLVTIDMIKEFVNKS